MRPFATTQQFELQRRNVSGDIDVFLASLIGKAESNHMPEWFLSINIGLFSFFLFFSGIKKGEIYPTLIAFLL